MIKIALTGEGPTDYGVKEFGETKWGPAYWYIQELLGEVGLQCEFEFVSKIDVKKFRSQRSNSLKGMSTPAWKFHLYSLAHGYEAGIFYSDTDKASDTKNKTYEADKRFHERYEEISKGLDDRNPTHCFIPMLALRMIENWQLADKEALEKAYGISIQQKDMPAKPEYVWGDEKDTRSNHPKNFLRRIVTADRKHGEHVVNRESMSETARLSRPEVLLEKCPTSYGRFCTDMEKMTRHIRVTGDGSTKSDIVEW